MCVCVCVCMSCVHVVFVCVCVYACVCECVLPHAYSGVCYVSVQCTCTFRGPDGDTMSVQGSNTMHAQRTNPTMCTCTCTEDQSYGTGHVATHTYVVSQERALCHVRKASYKGTHMQTCSESSCQKNGCLQHLHRKNTEHRKLST